MSIKYLEKYHRYRIGIHDESEDVTPFFITEKLTIPSGRSELQLREKIYSDGEEDGSITIAGFTKIATDTTFTGNEFKVSKAVDGFVEINNAQGAEVEITIVYQGLGTIVGERLAYELWTMNEHDALLKNVPNRYADTVFIGGTVSQGDKGVEIGVGIGDKNGTSESHVTIGYNANCNGNKNVVIGTENDAQGERVFIVGESSKTFFLHKNVPGAPVGNSCILGAGNILHLGAVASGIVGCDNEVGTNSYTANIMGQDNKIAENSPLVTIVGTLNEIPGGSVSRSTLIGTSNTIDEYNDPIKDFLVLGSSNYIETISDGDLLLNNVIVGIENYVNYHDSNNIVIGSKNSVGLYSNNFLLCNGMKVEGVYVSRTVAIGSSVELEHNLSDGVFIGNGAKCSVTTKSFDGGVAIGSGASVATNAISIGKSAVSKDGGIAIGSDTSVATNSIAIGKSASGKYNPSIAIGYGAIANKKGSVSIGDASVSQSQYAIAIGSGAIAYDYSTVSIGKNAGYYNKNSYNSIFLGASSGTRDSLYAYPHSVIGIGVSSSPYSDYDITIGYEAKTREESNKASSNNRIAIGKNAQAYGNHSIAIGLDAETPGGDGVGIGHHCRASGLHSTCLGEGANTESWHSYSTALGFDADTTASKQMKLGSPSITTKLGSGTTVTSDERDKIDMKDLPLGLNFIDKIVPKTFRYNPRENYYPMEKIYEYDSFGEPVLDENGEHRYTEKTKRIEVQEKDKNGNLVFDEREETTVDEEGKETTVTKKVPRMNFIKDKTIDAKELKKGSRAFKRLHFGFSAQQVIDAYTALTGDEKLENMGLCCRDMQGTDDVSEKDPNKWSQWSMRYTELIPVMVNAIQELTSRLEALEKKG